MPITLLYYVLVFFVLALLVINVVYPLLVPEKYKLFFMFRKDKYRDAMEELENSQRDAKIKKVKETIKSNKGEKGE